MARWVGRSSLARHFRGSWKKRLPFDECPNCGEYSYTTHKKAFYALSSPDAGRVNRTTQAEVRVDSCENCRLEQDKRLKIWVSEADYLKVSIDKMDRETPLQGFSSVEFVPNWEELPRDFEQGDSSGQ